MQYFDTMTGEIKTAMSGLGDKVKAVNTKAMSFSIQCPEVTFSVRCEQIQRCESGTWTKRCYLVVEPKGDPRAVTLRKITPGDDPSRFDAWVEGVKASVNGRHQTFLAEVKKLDQRCADGCK
jgi:hypothetical protein